MVVDVLVLVLVVSAVAEVGSIESIVVETADWGGAALSPPPLPLLPLLLEMIPIVVCGSVVMEEVEAARLLFGV